MGVASSHCHAHHTADRATVLYGGGGGGGGVPWEKLGTDSILFVLNL